MRRTFSLVTFLLCLVFSISSVYGQGNCSTYTIVGTYAFNFTGSSTIVNGASPDGYHWNALYAPIAGVGIFTVYRNFPRPGATADGSYWMVAGAMDLGHSPLDPTPFHAEISVNRDCTGVMNYTFGSYAMSEQMLILDDGNEIRSVSAQTATPTSNWIRTSRRIGGACTQVVGSYLQSCKSLFPLDPTHIFAGASLITLNIAGDGTATGILTGKFGSEIVPPMPVSAVVKVNTDCTASGTLDFGIGQSVAKGVFFNEGKEGYWLPLVNNPGAIPAPYGYCDMKQIANR